MAQKTMGSIVRVGTATAATKAITGITAASPPVVTATAHGYSDGDIVLIAGVVGMTQVNNRAFVVSASTTNTFELKGVDATGYTAYASGGTAAKKTMTAIGEVVSVPSLFDGEANDIDVTHLGSSAEEQLQGIPRFGGCSLQVLCPSPNDTGQTRMRKLKSDQSSEAFTVTLPSGQVSAFMAFVKSFVMGEIGIDGAVRATASLRHASEPAFFA